MRIEKGQMLLIRKGRANIKKGRAYITSLHRRRMRVLGYRGKSGHKQGWFCMGSVSRLNAPPAYIDSVCAYIGSVCTIHT